MSISIGRSESYAQQNTSDVLVGVFAYSFKHRLLFGCVITMSAREIYPSLN
jgi:hypothetical protein